MKIFVFFIAGLIAQSCALPADTPAVPSPANATTDATKAIADGAKLMNASQVPNATDAMSKLLKDGHGPPNPALVAKHGELFISTVIAAFQNFIKSLFQPFAPTPALPGMDGLTKMPSILPLEMGKNWMDGVAKLFNPLAKGADADKVKDSKPDATKAANETKPDAGKVPDAPAGPQDIVSGMVKSGTDMMDNAVKMFNPFAF